MNKQELIKMLNRTIEDYTNKDGFGRGVRTGLSMATFAIKRLDEPEKAVIPQFVADWYEQEGSRRKWWNWFYKWAGDQSDSRTVLEKRALEWMQDFNEGLFVDIFRYGYEIEKEKLYVVVLSNSNEKFGTYENVFLNKKDGVAFIDSCRLSINDIKKHSQFALTEKQIKDYDPRFMPFAVEVAE